MYPILLEEFFLISCFFAHKNQTILLFLRHFIDIIAFLWLYISKNRFLKSIYVFLFYRERAQIFKYAFYTTLYRIMKLLTTYDTIDISYIHNSILL